jgi:hypothetical protein
MCAVWKNHPDQVTRICPKAIKPEFGIVQQDAIRWALWLAMEYKLTAAADALIRWCKENEQDKDFIQLLNIGFHFAFDKAEYRHVPMLRHMVQQVANEVTITYTTMYKFLMDDPTLFINIRYPTVYWYHVFNLQCWRIVEWIITIGYKSWDHLSKYEPDIVSKAFRARSAARRIQCAYRRHRRNKLYARILWALTRGSYALSPEIARVVLECSRVGCIRDCTTRLRLSNVK